MQDPPFRLTRRAVAAGLGLSVVALPIRAETPPRTWRAIPVSKRMRPESPAPAETWTFEGPGPGIEGGIFVRIPAGREISARLLNETPKPLSFHWHGVRGPNAADGVGGLTQEALRTGDSGTISLVPPDPGTFLVRPCVIGGSAEPAERGLTGLLVVDEAEPPPLDRDIALLVDDWLLAENGDLAPFEEGGISPGRLGNLVTINGGSAPAKLELAPGSRIRLRVANACNARIMRLTFEGLKPYVAAVDGQPTDTFEPLRASVPFAPGNRYDFILDLPAEPGASGSLIAAVGQGLPLLTIGTKGERVPPRPAIAPLPPNRKLPAEIKLQAAIRKDVVIRAGGSGGPAWSINGKPGAAGQPLAAVKKGQPVVLALKNETPLVQPFHLHGHVFRLLHPFDDGWEPYFLDTVQVPENRTIRIAFVADNPGKWLLASTVLERFDAGLWTWIQVG